MGAASGGKAAVRFCARSLKNRRFRESMWAVNEKKDRSERENSAE
jgi:hypothetical protein